MDHLSRLPLELLQQVLDELSASLGTATSPGFVFGFGFGFGLDLPSPSIQSLSALPLSAPYLGLSSLATTSRHFYRHVAPLMHSLVCLDSSSHLTAFVEACTRPPKILKIATPIGAVGSASAASKNAHTTPQHSKWSHESIQRLLSSPLVRDLQELHTTGVESTSALLRVLDAWAVSSQGSGEASGADTGLKRLVIKADHPRRNVVQDGPDIVEGIGRDLSNLAIESDRLDPKFLHLSSLTAQKPAAPHPCPLLALLCRFSLSLEELSLACFAFSAPLPSQLGVKFGRLRHLSLHHCDISAAALAFMLEGSRMKSLELVACLGLTRDGIINIAQRYGQHLRSLRLEADTSLMGDLPPPSPPRAPNVPPPSPFNSPRQHRSAETRLLSSLRHVLDSILPHTPNLIYLTWSGPLASSDLDFSTLTPRLRTLSISQCPIWSDSSTLCTLFSGVSLPLNLRQLIVERPIPNGSCSSASELDATGLDLQEVWGLARSKDLGIELGGSLFECLNERMRWADEVGWREANRGEEGTGREDTESRRTSAGTGRRRKRPSLC